MSDFIIKIITSHNLLYPMTVFHLPSGQQVQPLSSATGMVTSEDPESVSFNKHLLIFAMPQALP